MKQMKKYIMAIAMFIAIFLLLPRIEVQAATTSSGCSYQVQIDGTVTITGCNTVEKSLIIPSKSAIASISQRLKHL